MPDDKVVAPATLQDFAPEPAELADQVLFGDVWEGTHLASYAGWPDAMPAINQLRAVAE